MTCSFTVHDDGHRPGRRGHSAPRESPEHRQSPRRQGPSPYRPGRNGDWLKIKFIQSDSFAILGYEPSTAMPGAIASLLLAARKGRALVYISNRDGTFRQLDAIKTAKPAAPVKGLVFTEPNLVAEIDYCGWTGDGKLRHASVQGAGPSLCLLRRSQGVIG